MNRSMASKMIKAKREASKAIKDAAHRESIQKGYSHIPAVFLNKPYSVCGVARSVRNYSATVAV